jgi:predicted TIM-barrel enzyme
MNSRFLDSFSNPIPVLAMLHLKGDTEAEKFDRARREIEILWESGVDSIIVENYYGTTDDVIAVCEWLSTQAPDVVFGINILRDDTAAFDLATRFGARFVQLDSVAGHLTVDHDEAFGQWLNDARAAADFFVLGGVRFKYQAYLSGRSLEEDLRLGASRCDAIVVTGDGTGLQTPTSKTHEFRSIVGAEFPLVIGAGVTPASCGTDLADANAVIVGSYLKDTFVDTGDVDRDHAREFVRAIRQLK